MPVRLAYTGKRRDPAPRTWTPRGAAGDAAPDIASGS
jgi:hypothetical protein